MNPSIFNASRVLFLRHQANGLHMSTPREHAFFYAKIKNQALPHSSAIYRRCCKSKINTELQIFLTWLIPHFYLAKAFIY